MTTIVLKDGHLYLSTPYSELNAAKARDIPNRKWIPGQKVWLCRKSLANMDYIHKNWPDAQWDAGSWQAYQEALEKLKQREQQLYLQAWNSVIADPDYSLFGVFHSSQRLTGLNRGVYGNPEVDKLLDEGKRVADGPEREAIYHKLQRMIIDDAAWGYLHVNELLIGMQKNVKGFLFDPSGNHKYYQVYFE